MSRTCVNLEFSTAPDLPPRKAINPTGPFISLVNFCACPAKGLNNQPDNNNGWK